MTSSIILLLVFQVFWLSNSYEKANFDLRRETTMLFRTTIFALRDSFLVRNIQSVPGDSSQNRLIKKDTLYRTTTAGERNTGKEKENAHIEVFISSSSHKEGDSVSASLLRPLVSRIQADHSHGRNKFFIRMSSDSLSVDSVRNHFQKSLLAEGIKASFKINHAAVPPPPFERGKRHRNIFRNFMEDSVNIREVHAFSGSIESEWVHYNPLHQYSVVLTDFRGLLIREIMPQIFFSIFLTVVTLVSFIILYRSLRSQQRLMELKNDFISNMTHELKTPIATVSVALEALKNFNGTDNPKRMSEYLDMAQHELNRLTILTDNVLKTSLFEDHTIDYVPESVDMEKTIGQVYNSMKLVFEKHNATINFSKAGNNFNVRGSSIHLTNVIYNLLDNALKYSIDPPRIDITLHEQDEKISIIVKDHGIGIAPEYKNKIFEKFFRVPTGDVHTIKGYGLGLNYVNSVVKEHGGSIHVESEPGVGSAFSISFPKIISKS
jgi:signal transduction histidine kinase